MFLNSLGQVCDFGLAASVLSWGNTLDVPAKDATAGTIPYKGPEQYEVGELTPQVDVFAIGVIGTELFTGVILRDGKSAAAQKKAFKSSKVGFPHVECRFC